jgi:hypothetical protein
MGLWATEPEKWKIQAELTNLIMELEDKGLIRCLVTYPSDIAIYILNRKPLNSRLCVYDIHDPVQYRPTWSIYKTIANGFSWKGRKR